MVRCPVYKSCPVILVAQHQQNHRHQLYVYLVTHNGLMEGGLTYCKCIANDDDDEYEIC